MKEQIEEEFSLEIDSLSRSELVKEIHDLEFKILSSITKYDVVIDQIFNLCESFLETSSTSGITKIATGSKSGCTIDIEDHSTSESQKITKNYIDVFVSIYKMYRSENDENKKRVLQNSVQSAFLNIEWSSKVRSIIQRHLSHCLDASETIRKRVNIRIKQTNGALVGKFAFLDFLSDPVNYPIKEEVKIAIFESIQEELARINESLGVDFCTDIEEVSEIIALFRNFKEKRNEVLLSVRKWIASSCRSLNVRNKEDILEATHSASIEVMEVLYKYKTSLSLMTFITPWVRGAILKYKESKKMLRAPGQISQKRKKIYTAYNDISKEFPNREIDFEKVSKRLTVIDPTLHISAQEIQNYIRTEDVTSIGTGSDNDFDNTTIFGTLSSADSLYGPGIFDITPEEDTIRLDALDKLMDSIEKLSEIDKTLVALKMNTTSKEYTITEMAKICGITYDQCRRRLERVNTHVDSLKESWQY